VKRFSPLILAALLAAGCVHNAAIDKPEEGGAFTPAWTLTVAAASGIQLAAVPGGFLVATPSGDLVKVAAADGASVWRAALGAKVDGAILVAAGSAEDPNEGFAAVPLEGAEIALVSLASGEVRARIATALGSITLAASRGSIAAVSKEGIARLYKVGSPLPAWESRLPAPPSAPGTFCAGRLMIGMNDGRLVGLDLEAGEVRTRKNLRSPVMTAPGCLGTRLYVVTQDNILHALRLYRRHAGQRWHIRSGADPAASPLTFKNDVLLLSKDTFLYGFQRSNGHLVFRAHLDRRPGPGALLDDLLFVAGPQSTRLDAYRLPLGRGAGTFTLPEAARFITPPVASAGRVAIAFAKYGEEASKVVGIGPKKATAPPTKKSKGSKEGAASP
jgi:outer membrane protein assembly factor BamB